MNIGARVKELRKSLGLTQKELAEKCGYKSLTTINKIELGINNVPLDVIEKLAATLQVSPSYLVGWETNSPKPLSNEFHPVKSKRMYEIKGEELNKIRKLQKMSIDDLAQKANLPKGTVEKVLFGIVKNPRIDTMEAIEKALGILEEDSRSINIPGIRPVKLKKFPMLGEIACGKPIYAEKEFESFIDASDEINADFCLTAKGDSMIDARIHDGDVVFIKEQPVVENGEIAAVIIGNDVTLKRWFFYPETKKLILQSANQNYAPFVYVNEELEQIRCLGRAVCFISNL